MKVSIVVPVYNGARYLKECLDSLLGQTLSDFEVVVVDDCSTDSTPTVLLDYARRDPRVRVLTQRKNLGVSCARNRGIEAARGEYVGFCDADDWIEPPMYEVLYDAAKRRDADMSFCGVFKNLERRAVQVNLPFEDGACYSASGIRETIVPAMLSTKTDSEELPVSGYTPRNLFRRELLAGLSFDADIHYAEDLLFIVRALLRANAAVVVNRPLYHYRFHAQSVTKRYSPYVPASHERCHQRLEEAFRAEGLLETYAPRMRVRKRKSAVQAVENLCLPGTPYGFWQRVREARAYMRRESVRELFAGFSLRGLPPRLFVKYALMRGRQALALTALFSLMR